MAATNFFSDTSQFDLARKRAADQSATNLQARKDALARRFASLGNLDSGARLKQEQIAEDEESKNLTQANEGINAQQQQEMQRRAEIQQGQEFQSGEAEKARLFAKGEREAGQLFSSGEAEKGRKFTTSERLGGQDFAAGQAGLGRQFATSEREAGQKFAAGESALSRGQQADQFNKQLGQQANQFSQQFQFSKDQADEAKRQFEQTFGEELRVNKVNEDFARQTLAQKDILDKILSSVGIRGDNSSLQNSLIGGAIGGIGGASIAGTFANTFGR